MRVPQSFRSAQRRLTRSALALGLAFACTHAGLAQAADPPKHLVQDPHYGDALYYFFQERYFTSVTNLMVSQHFERMPHHVDEAEILRGGLFLSYGLHREAGEIFTRLIDQTASPSVRDRAWYYLAKIRYQRGLQAEAEDAIARIQGKLPGALDEDRLLLQANLLFARGDYAGAAKVLQGIDAKSDAAMFAKYNLGVALIKNGDAEGGAKLLDVIGMAPAADEDMRALRDKANVALGFAALQEEKPGRARVVLERVRLNGMLANKALLGMGWAAQAEHDARGALVPWDELGTRDPSDAAVLEAKLAIAYAFADLGASGQALDAYNDAIATFERENTNLDESISAIRAGHLVEGLIERNPGEEMGWFWNIRELPAMPHAGHLAPVLAQHEFQEAFKNYRDLRFLVKNLQDWQNSLGAFRDMLDNRRKAFAERLPKVREHAGALNIDALEQRGAQLAETIARAERETDVAALATGQEIEQADRLARVRETIALNQGNPAIDDARDRARRVQGALLWQQSQAFNDRLWQAKKSMRDHADGIAQARRMSAALAQAERDEPARFDAFEARIVALGQRIDALLPRVTALLGEQQQYVQERAVTALEQQKERLANYTTQARYAVAQLYDRANQPQDAENARPQ